MASEPSLSPAGIPPAKDDSTKLGSLLVAEGFITPEQLEEALRIQRVLSKNKKKYRYLGQILVEKNYLDPDQLQFVMHKHGKQTRIGDILLRCGAITEKEFKIALKEQEESGERLGEIFLRKGLVSDDTLRQALGTQLNIPFIDISRVSLDSRLSRIINRDYAFRHQIIPIALNGDNLTLAMDDPTNREVVVEIEMFTRLKVNVVTSSRAAIREAFKRLYPWDSGEADKNKEEKDDLLDFTLSIEQVEDDLEGTHKPRYVEFHESKRADVLVQKILGWAIQHRASDIHLETLDQRMVVRFRIDGLLQEFDLGALQESVDRFHREIISRIKILGKLDIAEKRLPQDGSFRSHIIRNGERTNLDFRISVIPCYYGENVVIRILDPNRAPSTLDKMGFSRKLTDRLIRLFNHNTGIILITGPTGSGKSTTLHSGLLTSYRPGLKVLTAEDPIEYVHEKFMQCEVNDKIGLTFASYIRVFLRHDPEIIMVGEIRDDETAEMAVRAAQTGHLVLSTLHTNDSLGAITRLSGLGIDPSMITSTLLGVISQRLVRRICPHCKTDYKPSPKLLEEFFLTPPKNIDWVKGRGCKECHFTGYRDRLPLAELWEPNNQDIILINKQAPIEELKESARQSTIPIMDEAILKLKAGETTLDELIRVLPYSFIADFRERGAH